MNKAKLATGLRDAYHSLSGLDMTKNTYVEVVGVNGVRVVDYLRRPGSMIIDKVELIKGAETFQREFKIKDGVAIVDLKGLSVGKYHCSVTYGDTKRQSSEFIVVD